MFFQSNPKLFFVFLYLFFHDAVRAIHEKNSRLLFFFREGRANLKNIHTYLAADGALIAVYPRETPVSRSVYIHS